MPILRSPLPIRALVPSKWAGAHVFRNPHDRRPSSLNRSVSLDLSKQLSRSRCISICTSSRRVDHTPLASIARWRTPSPRIETSSNSVVQRRLWTQSSSSNRGSSSNGPLIFVLLLLAGVTTAMVLQYQKMEQNTATREARKKKPGNQMAVESIQQKPAHAGVTDSLNRIYEIEFLVHVSEGHPIMLKPLQQHVKAFANDLILVFFRMYNPNPHSVTGVTTYSVFPPGLAPYVMKQQCFCFEELHIKPYESLDLPVLFVIEPNDVQECQEPLVKMVLLYTFFETTDTRFADPSPKDHAAQLN